MRPKEKLTPAEIAILSLVNEGETHGYGLDETIRYRGMRNWTDIGFSSIYAILTRLEKAKLISSRRDTSGKLPVRKLYQITGKGKNVLRDHIKLYLSEPEQPRRRIDIGAADIGLLRPDEAIQCLEAYHVRLTERIAKLEKSRKQQQPLPFGAGIIFDHGLVKGNAELRWVESIINVLKKGEK